MRRILLLIIILIISLKAFPQDSSVSLLDSNVAVGSIYYLNISYAFCHPIPCVENQLTADSIIQFLRRNNVIIEIESNTDYRGYDSSNLQLTINEANKIRNFILSKSNIDSTRIIAIGNGERKPRIVTMDLNRKYDFLPIGQELNKSFIESLKEREKQEICHFLNRSVLIRIIKKN